jgi:hypothetical protein
MTAPIGRWMSSSFRLTSGMELLDEWSQAATQAERNMVNSALFAVVDRSVFAEYVVVDDIERTMEFFVFARNDLIVKIRVHDLSSFGIVYVGPACAAPGLDRAEPRPEHSAPESEPLESAPEPATDVQRVQD